MSTMRSYEVFLARKPGLDESQNSRRRVEHVVAETPAAAIAAALQMPQNRAFRAVSVKEKA